MHKVSMQLHANKRVSERLGLYFNRHIAHEIIENICLGMYQEHYKAGRGRIWCYVPSLPAWVLYDKKAKRIVTVLEYYKIPNIVACYLREHLGVRI